MAPSTSPVSPDPREHTPGTDRFGLEALTSFYRFHARIYDWTRPFILFGRQRIVEGLGVQPGMRVLDVGCGTGINLPALVRRGALVSAVDCSEPMLERARRRLASERLGADFDTRPYGAHASYRESADRILFSYSLSMIPPFAEALDSARRDLTRFGRIGVVDFLDAGDPLTRAWLTASHVFLGPERLELLRRLFPRHRMEVCRAATWRYYLFWGATD